jgi:hypothetical protein
MRLTDRGSPNEKASTKAEANATNENSAITGTAGRGADLASMAATGDVRGVTHTR